jgi:hypothetical protein
METSRLMAPVQQKSGEKHNGPIRIAALLLLANKGSTRFSLILQNILKGTRYLIADNNVGNHGNV